MLMGASSSAGSVNSAAQMIDLLTTKTAKDLMLDMSMSTN